MPKPVCPKIISMSCLTELWNVARPLQPNILWNPRNPDVEGQEA